MSPGEARYDDPRNSLTMAVLSIADCRLRSEDGLADGCRRLFKKGPRGERFSSNRQSAIVDSSQA